MFSAQLQKMPSGERSLEEDDDSPRHLTDAEGGFLQDPAQWEDRLPQPFRFIDKLLQRVLRESWTLIEARERERAIAGASERIPELSASRLCAGNGAWSVADGRVLVWGGEKVCVVVTESGEALGESVAVGVEEMDVKTSCLQEGRSLNIVAAQTRSGTNISTLRLPPLQRLPPASGDVKLLAHFQPDRLLPLSDASPQVLSSPSLFLGSGRRFLSSTPPSPPSAGGREGAAGQAVELL